MTASRKPFDWGTWIDKQRQAAEGRIQTWSAHHPDTDAWHDDLMSDDQYNRALVIWARRNSAVAAIEAARETIAVAEEEAKALRGPAAQPESQPS